LTDKFSSKSTSSYHSKDILHTPSELSARDLKGVHPKLTIDLIMSNTDYWKVK